MKNVFHTGVIESWKGKSWTEQLEVPRSARSGAVQALPISLPWLLLNSKNYLKGFFLRNKQVMIIIKKTPKQTSLLFEYQWSVWFWSQFCYFLQFRFNLSSLSVTPCAHLPFFCPSLHPQWFYFVCCWSMALHKLWEWYAYGSLTNKSVYRKHRLPSRQNIKMSVHS